MPAQRKPAAKKSSSKAGRRSRGHNLSIEERKKVLANDPDVLWFDETSVCCRGCERTISLDRRDGSQYYPGFWKKHKVTKTCKLNRARYMSTLNQEDPETVNAAKILVSLIPKLGRSH